MYIFILIKENVPELNFWTEKKKKPSDKVASLWGEILQRGEIKEQQK